MAGRQEEKYTKLEAKQLDNIKYNTDNALFRLASIQIIM